MLASIVEGHGEVEALPLLVRRLVAERLEPGRHVVVHRPFRVGRDRLLKSGELERYLDYAALKVAPAGAVVVLLDADDDCPAELGPALVARAVAHRRDLPVGCVVAQREFEAWFLACATSLSGRRGLPDHVEVPDAPEAVRDAKGWLQDRRVDGFAYTPTTDQPALVAAMDLEMAQERSASFRKLCRDIGRLLAQTR